MPKVKEQYRQIDEDVSTAPPDLHTAVAQELAEQRVIGQWVTPVEDGPPVQVTIRVPVGEGQVTHCEPETKEQQLARAEARIKELFAEATTSGPPPADDASSRLRREAITQLIAEGWPHTDAVKCADRVKLLLDSDGDYTYHEALLLAQDECAPDAGAALPPVIADDEPEPLSELPSTLNPPPSTNDELAQILHNFERDTARLRKLLGMEGVAKKRRPKEAKSG